MDNPAKISDVTGSFERPLTTGETAAATKWLDRAWRILRDEIPGVVGRLTLAEGNALHLDEESVVEVLVAMVERKLRNPDGIRQWSDDTYGQTVDTTLSSGQLYITAEERSRLAPQNTSGGGFYSIPLSTRS